MMRNCEGQHPIHARQEFTVKGLALYCSVLIRTSRCEILVSEYDKNDSSHLPVSCLVQRDQDG
jgi:hypothetical protein